MYLVMELCVGGELSKLLRDHGALSEEETRIIMEQIARAISYLHRNGNFRALNTLTTQLNSTQLNSTQLPVELS